MSLWVSEEATSRRIVLIGAARVGIGVAASRLGGGAIAASLGSDEARVRTATVRQTVSPGRTLAMYMAVPPRVHGRRAAVMVAHGDDGLDENAQSLARHVALLGFVGCAPDFLSRAGGTPAERVTARAMMARLDRDQAVADALGTVQWLGRNPPGERVLTGKVGSIGGGWGAALVERLAVEGAGAIAAAILLSPTPNGPAGAVPLLRLTGTPDWTSIDAFLKERLA